MMNLSNKRVFISGGAGVIGQELVKILVADSAIVMVGDLKEIPKDYPKQVIYRRGDLNYITQQELDYFNPEVYIHLAATFERSTESYEHWEENFWHNIRLSNHLMTLMRNVPGIKRVVNASSYLIYDKSLYNFDHPKAQAVKLKETDSIDPRNLTGLAKLAHEVELDFLSKFKSDKFSSISARIYRGYGKNSRDIISRWIRDLLEDKEITVYKDEGWFDYMYAGDTAKGLYKLACINASGIVNLGTGRSRQVKDVVNVLLKHFPSMKVTYGEMDIQYEASEGDTTKLRSLINWVPERYLEDVIPEIIVYEKNRESTLENTVYKNVLVTSASKKIPLIKALKCSLAKISSNIKVIGGDADPNCLAKSFVDDFWVMPRLDELKTESLIEYCRSNGICLIVPTRDGELDYFAEIKEELANSGIHVMVSSSESVIRCLDKLTFYENNGEELGVIPTYSSLPLNTDDTFVVKERYGAGSHSIGVNLNESEAHAHALKLSSPIFQPCINGIELSVDAFITNTGHIKGVVMRTRDLVVNGESQITKTLISNELKSQFIKIIDKLNLYGHIILQAFIDKDEKIHVIECNPRFGGASTLSIKAGLDSFYWVYLEALGESLADYQYIQAEKPIVQIRHASDTYS